MTTEPIAVTLTEDAGSGTPGQLTESILSGAFADQMAPLVHDTLMEIGPWYHDRQGDLYLLRLPDNVDLSNLKPDPDPLRFVLATGANGHAHSIMPVVQTDEGIERDEEGKCVLGDVGQITVFESLRRPLPEELQEAQEALRDDLPPEMEFTVFKTSTAFEVVHEEHAHHLLPPGCFIAFNQVEFGPDAQRVVFD